MKKVFFALILNLFIWSGATRADDLSAYQKECLDFISRPKVEVYGSYGNLRYNYDKDSAYLTQEQEKKVKAYSAEETNVEMKVLGLTKMQDTVDFKSEFTQLALNKGYICLYPENIQISIDYYLPTIYIANELQKGTCLYDITLRHERTHAQIYIEALDYFLPRLKKYADALFDNIGVKIITKGESVDNAMSDLSKSYHDAVQKRIDAWYKAVEKEQLKMDTIEQYKLESRICQEIEAAENAEEF